MRFAHAEGMGECAITDSVDAAPSARGWGYDDDDIFAVPLSFFARKRAVFALRAGKLYEAGIRTKCGGDHRSPPSTVSIAVKRDSAGRACGGHLL